MTSGLRKIHKISWLLIAIAGVVFLYFAMSELNFSSEAVQNSKTTEVSSIDKTAENDWIKVTVRENQVEVILKKTLKASSSVVYALDESTEKGNGLGQVSTVGIYQFETKESIQGILIWDEIKDVELTKLNF